MRDNATVANILDIISRVDFSTTKKQNDRISVFETTIRYLGGMIACMYFAQLFLCIRNTNPCSL